AVRGAKAMIADGRLGRPFGGTCIFNMALFNRQDPRFPYTWFARAGTGVSAVRNLGSHALHMLIHLFGPIESVVAFETQVLPDYAFTDGTTLPAETKDFVSALLRFANGMTIQFQICWNAPLGRGFHLEAYGSGGRFTIDAPSFPTVKDTVLHTGLLGDPAMTRVPLTGAERAAPGIAIDADHPVPPAFPMALSMQAMIRAIEGDGPARPDFGQAWQVERVQEAIRLSAIGGRWVALAEIA
ncbi:MAG: Gfo/Idh/MocA family oxidoreductase, partial [Sphingomonas sp.]